MSNKPLKIFCNKKGEFPVVKTILILFITSFIFISYILLLFQASDITIDTKRINTQLVFNKLLNSQCFSDEFATVEVQRFDEENLRECFKNMQTDIFFRIRLENGPMLYSQHKEEFDRTKELCNLKGNILCSKMVYPIIVINQTNEYKIDNLIVEIITK